jgi:hypothetical protein
MKYKLIACEIAQPEFEHVVTDSEHDFDVEYLPQGYHSDVEVGRREIQRRIEASTGYDAVILGYGLCNNMLAGIRAADTTMIVARAHDCITWFMGSKERYRHEFDSNPGTYYYTPGWLGVRVGNQKDQHYAEPDETNSNGGGIGVSGTYEEIVEKYGEDNAQFLMEMSNAWTKHYKHGTYISLPFYNHEEYRPHVHEICNRNDWQFREMDGDIGLLHRWINGPWEQGEFLVVPPGSRIIPTFDTTLITIAHGGGTRKDA